MKGKTLKTYSNMDRNRTSSGCNSLSARRCNSQISLLSNKKSIKLTTLDYNESIKIYLDPQPNLSAWTAVSK